MSRSGNPYDALSEVGSSAEYAAVHRGPVGKDREETTKPGVERYRATGRAHDAEFGAVRSKMEQYISLGQVFLGPTSIVQKEIGKGEWQKWTAQKMQNLSC
jgi:hypothetical protein